MSDRWVVVLAAAAAGGALWPSSFPLAAALAVAAVGWWRRLPLVLCVGAALATSVLAQRALDGLSGLEPAAVAGAVTLLSDPEAALGGVRAEARLGGRRVEVHAGGSVADDLAPRLAGEVLRVRGDLSPLTGDLRWSAPRHVAGRLDLLRIEGWSAGDPVRRAANGLRRTLADGARPLSATHRSLYAGLVVGDDRAQPAALADDFLGAGLTHLLAVSGQNVAFVLAVAGPALRRLRLWPRLAGALLVIAMFGLVTRFEPSVLRASAMAALAATLTTLGRPVSRLRIIALATTALLAVDPLLVRSVGFQLSVAAAAAIVVLAPAITGALPGPPAVREALGVTVAAQLGVAPVLLSTFGPVPVASFPANLLAVPVAGLVMAWGLTAGMVAGLAGGAVADVVHAPTRLALDWLELVAATASGARLGELHLAHLAALAAGLVIAAAGRRRTEAVSGRTWRRRGLAVAAAGLVVATLAAHAPAPLRSSPVVGVVRWHAGGGDVVVLGGVGGRTSLGARSVLQALRREGVGAVDLLVVADASVPAGVVRAVADAHRLGRVVAHSGVPVEDLGVAAVRAPPEGAVIQAGGLRVRIVAVADRLVIDARPG